MELAPKILLVAIGILVVSAIAFLPASAQNATKSATNDTSITSAETDAALVGAKLPTVDAVSPSTQTVTSQPDQSSFLSLTVTCTGMKGPGDLQTLHVWLCDGTGAVVPGFTEVQVPLPTSTKGQTGLYSVQIEFKYWYPWNPAGGKYQIRAVVDDKNGPVSSVATYLGTYTYTRTTGFTIETAGPLFFGTLTYGGISGAQQMTIHNSGNGLIAVAAQANDWASSAPWATRLPVGILQASLTGGGPWQPMTMSAASVQNMQISYGPSTSTPLYWRIVVPAGAESDTIVLAGQYSTNVVLTVGPV